MERLFSYGTLQLTQVQLETFGRELVGEKDALPHYQLGELLITDPQVIKTSGKSVHPMLRFTGSDADQVEGTIFELTSAELAQADEYEVDDYVRKRLRFRSGEDAWAYVARHQSQRQG